MIERDGRVVRIRGREYLPQDLLLRRLGVSRQTLYRWRRREGFPSPLQLGGRGGMLWWDAQAVADWIERRRAGAAA